MISGGNIDSEVLATILHGEIPVKAPENAPAKEH